MNCDLLFVYGTLLKNSNNQIASFLQKNGKYLGKGYFYGELFDIGEYPGAVYDEKSKHRVYGHIFKITDYDYVLKVLDEYEEVGEKFPSPNEFIRKMVKIHYNDKVVICWTYLYNLSTENLTRIESGDYLEYKNRSTLRYSNLNK